MHSMKCRPHDLPAADKRAFALRKAKAGLPVSSICQMLGLDYETVFYWINPPLLARPVEGHVHQRNWPRRRPSEGRTIPALASAELRSVAIAMVFGARVSISSAAARLRVPEATIRHWIEAAGLTMPAGGYA